MMAENQATYEDLVAALEQERENVALANENAVRAEQRLLNELAAAQAEVIEAQRDARDAVAMARGVGQGGPRAGGIQELDGIDFHWTGGGVTAQTRRDEPSSMLAFRPNAFKERAKTEKECMAGLPASHHLSTPDKVTSDGKAVSFKTWIDRVRHEIEQRGMDPVFRLIDGNREEHYLLQEFGRAEKVAVERWVERLNDDIGDALDKLNLKNVSEDATRIAGRQHAQEAGK